jgi:epoxyqueuosine reductase
MFSSKAKHTRLIKNKAKELGFDYCGISRADFLEEEAPRLENWLKNNNHGEMRWMENHFDKRLDPRKLVEGSKSVISFLLNYFPEETIDHGLKVSKYAYGKDYHTVIKKKLKELMLYMQQEIGAFNGRAFVDSAPVMDKAWAEKGGLGWRGKNSNLIHPKAGSFFFVAELITDLELEYDGPMKDYCGTCTRCIDACPTDAIAQPYVVDGSKCISYLTIELKNNIPSEFKGKMENWVFGCDICQDVCPWNRFSKPHQEPEFVPGEAFKNFREWQELTAEIFDEVFKKSAVKRAKFEGLQKNIKFLA